MHAPSIPNTGLSPSTPFFFFVFVADAVGGGTVVVFNKTPPCPMLIVCAFYTSVVGVAPGTMVKVEPPMTTSDVPISAKVTPPAVTTDVVGLNG